MGTVKRRGVIISASTVTPDMAEYLQEGDFVVACDAGYRNAQLLGVVPDLIVGDFDSAPRPEQEGEQIVLPHVKDDTDTHYAARWLAEQGYSCVLLLGALGGKRMEHTLANVATGLFLARQGVDAILADAFSELHYLLPGKPLTLHRTENGREWSYFSLFPLDGTLSGVQISGAFYNLKDAVLMPDYPLGVSNEFVQDCVTLRCENGCGLVILSRADS